MSITKLFALNSDFENLRWLAGSLSVGVASAVMTLTKTVHPPAGATALLAAVQPALSGLGWLYIPVVLICALVTTVVACLVGNVQRQYPLYWWSPTAVITPVIEEGRNKGEGDDGDGDGEATVNVKSESGELERNHGMKMGGYEIIISASGIMLPDHLYIADEEREILQILEQRLRESGSPE